MLAWRLGISAVLIPLLVVLFRMDAAQGNQAVILLILCCLLSVRACRETTWLLSVRRMRPSFPAAALCSVLIVTAGWGHTLLNPADGLPRLLTSLGLIAGALVLSFQGLFIREVVRFEQPGTTMETLGADLLSVMYSGVLLAVTSQLRWFPSPEIGYFVLVSLIVAVKSGDTTAYAFGRLWGHRKMTPILSPGKTWMGAIGAVTGSAAGTGLWLAFGGHLFEAAPAVRSWPAVFVYGVGLGIVGLTGDLCESLIKRDVDQKDSASLMPGFGGLLDLLDSVLFSGPFALAFWIFWPPATAAG